MAKLHSEMAERKEGKTEAHLISRLASVTKRTMMYTAAGGKVGISELSTYSRER
jgi:hypothetical protein